MTTVPVFRFKFEQNVVESVMDFAKTHQYDDRHEYKEAWKSWCIDNQEMLEMETKRLEMLGYEGDVYDKLFKSGRYYFRNKRLDKPAPAERKKYIGLGRDTLRAMDDFVGRVASSGISPAEAFTVFCKESTDVLRQEIASLISDHDMADEDVRDKLKKTFKNRYFQKIRKLAVLKKVE